MDIKTWGVWKELGREVSVNGIKIHCAGVNLKFDIKNDKSKGAKKA